MKLRYFSALTLILLLTGCARVPPISHQLQDVEQFKEKKAMQLRSVSVSTAPDTCCMKLGNALFKDSLIDATDRALAFDDRAERYVSLRVVVSHFGGSEERCGVAMYELCILLSTSYEIYDRNDGEVLFATEIDGIGRSRSEALGWDAMKILAKAGELAIQNNVQKFLTALDMAEL